jgi:RNA polymerase sigma-70 factor (ECF subfamily)
MINNEEREQELKKLIELAQNGDEEAFLKLRDNLNNEIEWHLKSWIKEHNEIEDVLQETWIKVMEIIDRYDPEKGAPKQFILAVANNQAKSYYRKIWNRRKKTLSIDTVGELSDQLLEQRSEESDPADRLYAEEQARKLEEFYLIILKATFLNGGYPHQILAFSFCKLIFPCITETGKKVSKRVSGYPDRVVNELFDILLTELSQLLQKDYLKYSVLHKEEASHIFLILNDIMDRTLSEIIDGKGDKSTWGLLAEKGLLERSVGTTVMRNYCKDAGDSKNLVARVSDWCYKVQKKVKRYFDGHPDRKIYTSILNEILGFAPRITN